jgi:hypothetical protein
VDHRFDWYRSGRRLFFAVRFRTAQRALSAKMQYARVCPCLPVVCFDSGHHGEATRARIAQNYCKLPLSFEENLGQTAPDVRFLSRGHGYTLFLTPTEAVFSLAGEKPSAPSEHAVPHPGVVGKNAKTARMKLVGANPFPKIAGMDALLEKSNYFIGNHRAKWRADISNYARVKYSGIYPGIDLFFYGNQRQVECDWVVAPGADPQKIGFRLDNADRLRVDAEGNLELDGSSDIFLRKPWIYQERGRVRTEIAGGYAIEKDGRIGFRIAAYDASLPIVIDPVLVYSTYLGGSNWEEGNGIAVDSAGNAYIIGSTTSNNFPIANPFQAANAGLSDAFVTKLNSAGRTLVYSTYLGGSNSDGGYRIAVDSAGSAYVTGATYSSNFPAMNPFQAANAGVEDAFVAKIEHAAPPMLEIALNKATYVNGDTVVATSVRLRNPGPAMKVELAVWIGLPAGDPIPYVNIGSDGSFVAPAGFDQDYGPITLAAVTSALPRGNYEFSARIVNPVTKKLLSEDINEFVIQ